MNFLTRETRPSFYVLARSVSGKSALKMRLDEGFGDAKIRWALDINDLLSEVALTKAGVAIVELTGKSIVADCQKAFSATTDFPRIRLFSVAEPELKKWRPLIRVSGFADCYWSVGQLDRMTNAIRQHLRSQPSSEKNIEERVSERLPWKPCP